MSQRFPLAAITDEFSPDDLERATASMQELGMTAAELRVVFGKNIVDLSDEELERVRQITAKHGLKVISIASPLLKCTLPDAPPIDTKIQHDVFGQQHTIADQPRIAERAFAVAKLLGAKIIRVFSYWRTVDPDACFDRVVVALRALTEQAAQHGLIIAIENEHACNIATAAESARLLKAIDHPNFKVIWDPANAYVSGEHAYPDGYRLLPVDRIVHVHAKDCTMAGHNPVWGAIGEGDVNWKAQLQSLESDGYKGYISLETHWKGPHRDKHEASMICGRNLKALVMAG
ncbi:MAG TPA: sugar phosphate isomerase/epimerase family protein [Bryobacteraceae bacterium]|nr:sugar phosphate isomerase/epimerase family protein [Bryobacteraceae bacterium]